ncbi:hypothetical protein SLS62_006363 [Diatrype stigma]|uniref:Uncharacterized protein n=1 Tax=Diatrype stigma TaxID=117547 RepID=A0AAN9UQW4_9PEZI
MLLWLSSLSIAPSFTPFNGLLSLGYFEPSVANFDNLKSLQGFDRNKDGGRLILKDPAAFDKLTAQNLAQTDVIDSAAGIAITKALYELPSNRKRQQKVSSPDIETLQRALTNLKKVGKLRQGHGTKTNCCHRSQRRLRENCQRARKEIRAHRGDAGQEDDYPMDPGSLWCHITARMDHGERGTREEAS